MTDLEAEARAILHEVWSIPSGGGEPSPFEIAAVLAGMRWAAEECARIIEKGQSHLMHKDAAGNQIRARFFGASDKNEISKSTSRGVGSAAEVGLLHEVLRLRTSASPEVPTGTDSGRAQDPVSSTSSEKPEAAVEAYDDALKGRATAGTRRSLPPPAPSHSERAALVERARASVLHRLQDANGWEWLPGALDAVADFALAETAALRHLLALVRTRLEVDAAANRELLARVVEALEVKT